MDHLPVEVHTVEVEQRVCPCGCGAEAKTIRHEVSWRLERVPARMVRHKIIREVVAFPDHDEGRGTVVTAPPPATYALPRAMCGNQLLAQIVLDKYADHLPLHRQE